MKNTPVIPIVFVVLIFNVSAFAGKGQKYTYHTCPTPAEASTAINGGQTPRGAIVAINGVQYQVYSRLMQIPTVKSEEVNTLRSGNSMFTGARHTVVMQPPNDSQIACDYQFPSANFGSTGAGYMATLVTVASSAQQCVHQISPSRGQQWEVLNLMTQPANVPSGIQAACKSSSLATCAFKCR